MLGSITPLGERARGFRFWPTATAYVVASALARHGGRRARSGRSGRAGGRDALPWTAGSPRSLALAVLGLAVDLGSGGLRLPTVHRQVNEEWMVRYRGWVYGAGFGFQLGLGVVTIVTTSAIYATLAAELLSGGVASGASDRPRRSGSRGPCRSWRSPRCAIRRQLGRVQVALARWEIPFGVPLLDANRPSRWQPASRRWRCCDDPALRSRHHDRRAAGLGGAHVRAGTSRAGGQPARSCTWPTIR